MYFIYVDTLSMYQRVPPMYLSLVVRNDFYPGSRRITRGYFATRFVVTGIMGEEGMFVIVRGE